MEVSGVRRNGGVRFQVSGVRRKAERIGYSAYGDGGFGDGEMEK